MHVGVVGVVGVVGTETECGWRSRWLWRPPADKVIEVLLSEALEVFLRVRHGEDPAADRRASRRAPKMTDLADQLFLE